MGWSLSWVALKGGSIETICSVFGLRPTGQREEVPESEIDSVQIPTGWCLVLFNRAEIEERFLKELSRNGEVVHCFVEDHVMFSSASSWRNGKELWHVQHNGGEEGLLHIETRGNLPSIFEGIRNRLFSEQDRAGGSEADVDHVYDIPAELGKELTGFRHDEDIPGLSGDIFQVLEPVKKAGSWLERLVGKKG